MTGWVVENRQGTIVDDTTGDNRWHPWPDDQSDSCRSALAVPIIYQSGVLGVFTLAHSTPNYFNVEDLQLMESAADQMMMVVRNIQHLETQRLSRPLV